MSTLVSFPGRYGDLLWACSVIRDISAFYGEPVDLQIALEFRSLAPLLAQQPYIRDVIPDDRWGMDGTPPPSLTAGDGYGYSRYHDLSYQRWPELPLPYEVWNRVASGFLQKPDLTRPWITVNGPGIPAEIAVGFTEAWFELKLGLLMAVERQISQPMVQLTPFGSRWTKEVPPGTVGVQPCTWKDAARAIRNSDLFLGDCSALHVLAVGMGKPVVLMEPMEARHNDIFYPLGKAGPVHLVTGTDGKPTFDARHCADTLKEALAHAR